MENWKRRKRKAAKLRRKQQVLQRYMSKCYEEEKRACEQEIATHLAEQIGCESPRLIERVPQSWCQASQCHDNVLKQVHLHGGRPVWGWHFTLNTAEEYVSYVDAVFHAVWEDPQGRLIDITPQSERVLAGQKAGVFMPLSFFCEDKRYFMECKVEDVGKGHLVVQTGRAIFPQRQALTMSVPAA